MPFATLKGFCKTGLLVLFVLVQSIWATNGIPAGNGSAANPYLIADYTDLKAIGTGIYTLQSHYRLVSDIDAAPSQTENCSGGVCAGFTPIGSFTGSFHGAGHIVKNLSIQLPNSDYVGLFYQIGANGRVDSLGVTNVQVRGKNYLGGLTGVNNGLIQECYASGFIKGSGTSTGGLAGYNVNSILKSYAVVRVQGVASVGGLVGYNAGTIDTSFSAGRVQGTSKVGGLVGDGGYYAKLYECYWDRQSSGLDSSYGSPMANGLTTEAMKSPLSYTHWSFSGTWESPGQSPYPFLRGLHNTPLASMDYVSALPDTSIPMSASLLASLAANDLEPDNPTATLTARWTDSTKYSRFYQVGSVQAGDTLWGSEAEVRLGGVLQIETYDDLKKIGDDPLFPLYGHYRLSVSIDASASLNENCVSGACEGFKPIGSLQSPFSGILDGNGNKIYNLFIQSNDSANTGLLGYTSRDALVTHLGVRNAQIRGKIAVGALVGRNYGTIEYSYATAGSVTGFNYTGGLVGYNQGILKQSYSATQVHGLNYVGGLTGYSNADSIYDCYTSGSVQGRSYVGGLVGRSNIASLRNSYAVGPVIGYLFVGGLAGYVNQSEMATSYWNRETTGLDTSMEADPLQGLTTQQMLSETNFAGWDFTGIWDMDEGHSYPTLANVFNAPSAYTTVNATLPALPQLNGNFASDPSAVFVGRWSHVNRLGKSLDSLYSYYQIGYVLGADDTLWGGMAPMITPTQRIPISSYAELKLIGNDPAYPIWGAYELTTDIDASPSATENFNGSIYAGFKPIGTDTIPFSGAFYGSNHAIRNLTINRPSSNYIGLFAMVAGNALIQDLTLSSFTIKGANYVGGITGYNIATLERIHASGHIVGNTYAGGVAGYNRFHISQSRFSGNLRTSGNYVGGLVGYNYYDGSIKESFASALTTGTNYVGGLIGSNLGEIENCYTLGHVSGSYAGGLVGNHNGTIYRSYAAARVTGTGTLGGFIAIGSGLVTESYWNEEIATTFVNNSNAQGLAASGMLHAAAFSNWDFSINSSWKIDEGKSYPALRELDNAPVAFPRTMLPLPDTSGGMDAGLIASLVSNGIDPDDPTAQLTARWTDSLAFSRYYQVGTVLPSDTLWGAVVSLKVPVIYIASYDDLKKIGNHPSYAIGYDYRLVNDIDASASLSDNCSGGVCSGFAPMGSSALPYSGHFNGAGHVIRNLRISRPAENYVGLFRVLASTARIDSLSVQYSLLQGQDYVGGISGIGSGFIDYSQVTGVIAGANFTGGMVGQQSLGKISHSFTAAYVTGKDYVGGLTAHNNGLISDSYSTGAVSGTQYLGGLVGMQNTGRILRSFSVGPVKVAPSSGGMIGYNYSASTNASIDSYWNTENSHQPTSAGMSSGTGSSTAQMQSQATFVNWDFTNIWDISEGASYPFLRGMGNAPFAFFSQAASSLPKPNVLGYYPPDPSATLVGRWLADSTLNSTRDSLLKTYQIGAILSPDDTIWGAFSHLAYPYEPIPIANYSDLKKIGTDANYPLWGTYRLTNDIDATPSNNENMGSGFVPIGTSTQPFTGSFRGGGHTISHLFINRTSSDYVGLFGYSSASLIDSLHLVDATVMGYRRTGILAGMSTGNVRDCSASGLSKSNSYSGAYTGGLIGQLSGSLENSHTNATVIGHEYVGGLVGYNSTKPISGSSARGIVNGYSYVGGLSGYSASSIDLSFATNTVTGSNNYAGGLVGYNSAPLHRSYFAGYLSAYKYGGGLVGQHVSGTIGNCYSTGIIMGSNSTGSLVGYMYAGSLDSSYTTSRVIKKFLQSDSIAGIASASLLQKNLYSHGSMHASDYPGLDFVSIWTIDEGKSYPYLRNRVNAPFALPVYAKKRPSAPAPSGYYEEDPAFQLVAKWQEVEAFNLTRDTLFEYFTIGAILASGDTLWAGSSYYAIPVEPIEIANYADLLKIGKDVAYPLSGAYKLTANIDASPSGTEDIAYRFNPIGSSANPFTGIFHGGGHVIRNLTMDRSTIDYTGLFASTSYATIDSVGVINVNIRGRYYAGALVGYSDNTSIHACYSSGRISGTNNIGGLVGRNNYGIITNSYATDSIQAASMAGGLVGENRYSTIKESYATGAVKISSTYAGGLVGYSYTSEIEDSYATGSVHGSSSVGGLIGNSISDKVHTSFAAGAVSSIKPISLGGLLGKVLGSTVDLCYWNRETSKVDTSAGQPKVQSLTTPEMLHQENFAGWNMTSVWQAHENTGYPSLRKVNNAPIAFADSLIASAVLPSKALFANDFDPETQQSKLVLYPDSLGPIRNIAGQLLMPSGSSYNDTLWIRYRIGEIRTFDTLWGNGVYSRIIIRNTPPAIPTPPEPTTAEDTPLILKISLLNLVDPDGDPLTLKIYSGDNYTVSGYRISPARDFNGTLRIPFSITDGMDTSEVSTLVMHVTPVNDAPLRVRPLPDLRATQDMSLPIDDIFTDVDGDSLIFTITSSDSALATGIVVDGKMLLNIADSAAGFLQLYISATDGHSPLIFDTVSVTLPGILPLPEPPPLPEPDIQDTIYADQVHLRFTGDLLLLELEAAATSLIEIILLDQNGSRLPASWQKSVAPGKYSWHMPLHELGTAPCIVAIRLNGKVFTQRIFHRKPY